MTGSRVDRSVSLCTLYSTSMVGMSRLISRFRVVARRNFECRFRSSFVVPDRAYIEVEGRDAIKFLQGICTNDVTHLNVHCDCVAAAFLTPKGRCWRIH